MSETSPFRDRQIPQAIEAEKGLLSSLLIDPVSVGSLCAQRHVTPDFFHAPAHAAIFTAAVEMIESGRPVDAVTLTQFLHDTGRLDDAGGAVFVSELAGFLPTTAHAAYYLDILEEKRTLREVIRVASGAISRAYEAQDDVPELLAGFEREAISIRRKQKAEANFTARDVAVMGLAEIQRMIDARGGICGLSTGFAELDKATDGMHGSELIVIAARPSLGKTALAMQIAEHVATHAHKPVGIISLEMGRAQLSARILLSRAKVNPVPWRHGRHATDAEQIRVARAAEEMQKAPIIYEDGSDVTIGNLRASARGMASRNGIKLLVVDSLSVLRSPSRQGRDNRAREVAECVNGAKEMAKELDIPVILIAHLGRGSEENERPSLTHLRESGNIEQDADSVWLLWEPKEDDADGQVEIFIPKNRNGERNRSVRLHFEKQFTRFASLPDAETSTQGEMI